MKIDIVMPQLRHSWNLGTGWVEALQRKGMLGRAFHLDQVDESTMYAHMRKESADMVLLMGGDHHLHRLHKKERKREQWNRLRVPRVAVCYESILDSKFPDSVEKSISATQAFTHFVYCDEKDSTFFEERGASAIWLPQCVDEKKFVPGEGFRKPQVFFRGKNDAKLNYSTRYRLLAQLATHPDFHYVQSEISDEALVAAYAEHACALNVVGNFCGYNVRTFEALAAGSILFQDRIPNRPRNEALFDERHMLYYSVDDPDALCTKITEVVANIGDYAEMARLGREACLAAHTIDHRIDQIVAFVDATYRSSKNLHLGCGSNMLPNFVNIDRTSSKDHVGTTNLEKLDDVEENSLERIYAPEALGRFTSEEAALVVRAWSRKLKPGGVLYVSVAKGEATWALSFLGKVLSRVCPSKFGKPQDWNQTRFDREELNLILKHAGFVQLAPYDPRSLSFTRWERCCLGTRMYLKAVKAR